ncbi:MAG: glycosyltransferase family 39 protein [Chloroflexi bacterium]|nr:glycosyltransferase family 39 protein [Chloroflexota bacterium]OJV96823.1 MAG: hypothetical protein BGO39_08965 [Chloroflexi bacterium 54-19]
MLKVKSPTPTKNLTGSRPALGAILARPYVVLFGIALALRLLVLFLVQQPGYIDAYYYYQVAANWHNGLGLTETSIWNFQAGGFLDPTAPANLVHPAFGYWMPLATLLVIPFFGVFGATFWAASLPFILCSAALPPLSYWLGKVLFGPEQRRYSWLMALVMLFPGRYFLFWNAPDNFAPFALISLLILAYLYLGLHRDDRWLLAVGGLCGLAYLSRSDGILLTFTFIVCFGWRVLSVRRRPDTIEKEYRPRWRMLIGGLALALLVVSPWLARNLAEFGTFLPANTSKSLFLRGYGDFFSYAAPLDLNYYLGWGWGNILGSKLGGLGANAFLLVFQGLFLLGPLFVIGLWPIRKRTTFRPFLIYSVMLYLVMALGFTEVGSHGTIFHSAGGLLPFQAGIALAGLEWIWRGKALPRAASIMAMVALGVTVYYALNYASPQWDTDYQAALRLGSWLDQNAAPKDVIMIGEPLSFQYATGRPAIAQASDGLLANLEAARRFRPRWFVLGPERYAGLDELYQTHTASGAGLQLKLTTVLVDGTQIYEVLNENKE